MAIRRDEQYFDFACGLGDTIAVSRRGAIVLRGAKAALDRAAILARPCRSGRTPRHSAINAGTRS